MTPRIAFLAAWLLIAATFCSASSFDCPREEIYRIRIQNKAGGLVQVSLDRGRTFYTLGRVTSPANARITGFAAASYIPQGRVAATSVHGIRVKTGQSRLGIGKAQKAYLFSIVPKEFATIPKSGYGGHIPRSSGIDTDIPAGQGIFRNFAPYAGDMVYLENDHLLDQLPDDYVPQGGEVFVIPVKRPEKMPASIEFENRVGGKVTVNWPDGTSEALTEVQRPVKGTGRFDGTTFTGVGSINTNHGGVITISTAPVQPPGTHEGDGAETRGGFMIQPYYHVMDQGETSPQVMVVGPKDRTKPVLEGKPPLFSGYISLARYADRAASSMRAEVRVDGGPWEPPPTLVGKFDDSFSPAALTAHFAKAGKPREATQGVTAVRLVFPLNDPALMTSEIAAGANAYARKVAGAFPSRSGAIVLAPSRPPRGGNMVSVFVDGSVVCTSNEAPYECTWDTRKVPNGLHEIQFEMTPSSGGPPVVETRRILVRN